MYHCNVCCGVVVRFYYNNTSVQAWPCIITILICIKMSSDQNLRRPGDKCHRGRTVRLPRGNLLWEEFHWCLCPRGDEDCERQRHGTHSRRANGTISHHWRKWDFSKSSYRYFEGFFWHRQADHCVTTACLGHIILIWFKIMNFYRRQARFTKNKFSILVRYHLQVN